MELASPDKKELKMTGTGKICIRYGIQAVMEYIQVPGRT
jgi:hypothetical protein